MKFDTRGERAVNALGVLQDNASNFFSNIFKKHDGSFSCKEGCSKCCYVDLSIFEVEAARISAWFVGLNEFEKNTLLSSWKKSKEVLGKNANGKEHTNCAFLVDERCSVYEVRPLICRTQGAPLYFEEDKIFDICPLNFENQALPEKNEWLNVERLNALLSLVQSQYAKDTEANSSNRISLKTLRKNLIEDTYAV